MNEPSESGPAAAPDGLLDRLERHLPSFARDSWAERRGEIPERDRERIGGDVEHRVLGRTAGDASLVLRETNLQIGKLQDAEKILAAHLDPPERAGVRTGLRNRAAHALFGLVLWFGLGYSLLWWQLSQAFSGTAWFFTVLALLVAAGLAAWVAGRLLKRSGEKLGGQAVATAPAWPFVTGFPTVYLLVLWRSQSSSREAMGGFWSGTLWVVTGVVTAAATFVAVAVASTPAEGEVPGRRLPARVVSRGLLAYVLALAAGYFVYEAVQWPPLPKHLLADAVTLLVMLGFAPLTLSSGLIPPWLSRDEKRKNSPSWKQLAAKLRKAADEAARDWATAARAQVDQRVKYHLDNVLNPEFTTTLRTYDRHALGQMRAGERVVTSVAAADRLRELLAGIEGGMVGMAGPRGAGKTTLLDAYLAGKFLEPGQRHIALVESAPVRYDAREFMLYLYSKTCAKVIDSCRRQGQQEGDVAPHRWSPVWGRRNWPLLAALLAWLVVGAAGTIASAALQTGLREQSTTLWWPLACLFGATATLSLAVRRRPAALVRESSPPPVPAGDLLALRQRAERALDGIRFQQKHTWGWSGKTSVPMTEAQVSGSRETTRNPLTYPEVVHEFVDFLKATIGCVQPLGNFATPSVVIIIDELDKIADPEAAQEFINEIKALLAVDLPGLLCLISVSEDALAAFERRGLPVRDAFDSAFDTIVRLEYLDLEETRQVLSSRVVGLPAPFVSLCHCLAGGLPRELIRVARRVFSGGGELADITKRMVAEDLSAKRSALRTVVGRAEHDDVLVSDLVRHFDAQTAVEPAELISAVAAPPISAAGSAPALLRMQTEILGYLYYLGTVLEVFGPAFSPSDQERGRTAGDGSFDTLASARQLFPVNARLAWLTISAFRKQWELRVVEPPSA